MPVVHQAQDLVALRQAIDGIDLDAEGADGVRRPPGGVDVQAEVAELFGKPQDLELILVVDGEVHAYFAVFAGMAELESRRHEALEQRLFDGLADAEHFARRLHLRPELRVDVVQLFKREHGHLDGDVRRFFIQPRAETELFQLRPHHDLGGELDHGHARDLGDVRDGARGARVDLDDVQFVAVHEVLDVDEALCL